MHVRQNMHRSYPRLSEVWRNRSEGARVLPSLRRPWNRHHEALHMRMRERMTYDCIVKTQYWYCGSPAQRKPINGEPQPTT